MPYFLALNSWLSLACVSSSPPDSLGTADSSSTGLTVNLHSFFFFKKKKNTHNNIFALLKSPTYDYSARGLGTSEHYQHAVGGQSSPTNTSS